MGQPATLTVTLFGTACSKLSCSIACHGTGPVFSESVYRASKTVTHGYVWSVKKHMEKSKIETDELELELELLYSINRPSRSK
jgi:hypothetical protein